MQISGRNGRSGTAKKQRQSPVAAPRPYRGFLMWYFLPPWDEPGWPWQRQWWVSIAKRLYWGLRLSVILTPILMWFGWAP